MKNKKFIMLTLIVLFTLSCINISYAGYYDKREEWSPARGTSLNISHYIYHDMNRNGIYDIGDRPLVDFVVKVTRPDGTSVIRRSNLNGFANFTNSLISSPVDIFKPGEYTYEVIPPDDWEVTSNNRIQKIKYREGTTERSSLVAESVPVPVGLVQKPKIEGSVVSKNPNKDLNIEIYALNEKNKKIDIKLNKDNTFILTPAYGKYKIVVVDKDTKKEYKRDVVLDTVRVKMSSIVIGEETFNKKANEKKIDFEDITHSTIQKIPNKVGGLNWNNLIVTDFLLYSGEGYVNNRMSGKYIVYNTSGQPTSIECKDGFDFYGGYFGLAWRNLSEGEILELKAYRNDKLVADDTFELSALGPAYINADYRNITKLEIKTRNYWQFVMDDILIGTN